MNAPDTEDWSWVLRRPCPECGLDCAALAPGDLAALVLEHACHVRDVHRVFLERVRLLLDHDDPILASAEADTGGYAAEDPDVVARDLLAAGEEVASLYASLPPGSPSWDRPARRPDGSTSTLASWGRHHLHDVVHHAWEVRRAVTIGAYDAAAAAYAGGRH